MPYHCVAKKNNSSDNLKVIGGISNTSEHSKYLITANTSHQTPLHVLSGVQSIR